MEKMVSDEIRFRQLIVSALSANPHWLASANEAIAEGMALAIRSANERSAKLDLALRCALGLVEKKRLDDQTRKLLVDPILAALPTEGATEIERRAKEWLAE